MDYEAKVNEFLDNAIEAQQQGDKSKANRQFRFAAFYEAKRLELNDPKGYANSIGDVI